MKIAFFASNAVAFHARSLEERPLGGTETAIVRLAEALQLRGHQVTVFTPHENPPPSLPRYLPLRMIESHEPVDAFIAVRDWIPIFYKIPAKKRFMWTGDSFDQFVNYGIGDRRISKVMDGLLCVSQWQAKALADASGFPLEKTWKLANGIELKAFQKKIEKTRKRLIYSSTPYRGLEHIPRLFLKLKERHPELECHIFSSYKIYDQKETSDYLALVESLKAQTGIVVHGSVLQSQLAEEFLKSSILFYPCHFEETSCITAMEAMASGCVVLSSALGALPETVGEAGVLIPGLPGRGDYDSMFLAAADRLLSDDREWKRLSDLGVQRAQGCAWSSVAESFESYLRSAHGCS
jgi:glycosyltransferase involved in cell wall biosynthesis